MTLGEKVKQLRSLRGWSQRELARQSGVRQTLLSDLETPARIYANWLRRCTYPLTIWLANAMTDGARQRGCAWKASPLCQ